MNKMTSGIVIGTVLIFAGIALCIWSMSRPNRIEVTGEELVIDGSYSHTVRLDEIKSCELLEQMPKICLRTNGIGLGKIQIGHFRVDGIGKCRLYLDLGYPPFVHVTTTSGEHIFFNTKDPAVTGELYDALSRAAIGLSASPEAL